jgi:serine/threonine-protein kinase
VFLVPDPALPRGERAKVLDFGIAKLADNEEGGGGLHTETGTLMGTPSYMSPEQCRGAGGVDHRSDIYALGCVLYQMLCGRPPFIGKGSGEVLAAHIHVAPESVRVYEDSVSTTLESVVMRLIEKDVDKRYQTMAEVIQALNATAPAGAGNVEPSLAASGHFAAMETEPDLDPVVFETGTTLGSTARQSAQFSAAAAPKGPLGGTAVKAVLGLALVTVTVTAVLLLQGDEPKKPALATADPVTQVSQKPAVVETTPPIEINPVEVKKKKDPAEADAKAPTKVVLTIESDPPGARVYRQSDGVRVGETPFDLTVRRGKGVAAFYLKKSGYRRTSLELKTDEDARVMTPLERRGGSGEADSKPVDEKPVDEKPVDEKPVDEKPVDEKPVDEKPVKTTPGRNDAIDPFGQPAKSVGSEP